MPEALQNSPSSAESVASSVERQILQGVLGPGHPLRVMTLAKSFHVPRSVIREALHLLEVTGLVTKGPQEGAKVAAVSPSALHEVFTLRAVLESFATRVAITSGRLHDPQLEAISAAYEALCDAVEWPDPVVQIEADMAFHMALCEPCGHALLLQHLKQLQARTRLCILYTKVYRSDAESEALSHKPILAAVLAGDVDAAESAVRNHINDAGQRLLVRMGEAALPASGRHKRGRNVG